MTAAERLRETVDRLQDQYDRHRARLAREIMMSNLIFDSDLTPEDMRDSHGRPILLDALAAIAHAQAVLALLEAQA